MMLRKFLAVAIVVLAPGVAQSAAADVEVVFSERMQGDMSRIDRIENRREKYFRKNRQEGSRRFPPNNDRVLFAKTQFAHERLIPELEDFSIQALAAAMVEYNLSKIESYNSAHTIRVEIDDFNAQRYSMARYSNGPTRMKGTISVVDSNGRVVRSERVIAAMVPKFSNNRSYQGYDYAYLRESMDVRFGPMFASFLEKGLERLYPGADVPGPVFIRRASRRR